MRNWIWGSDGNRDTRILPVSFLVAFRYVSNSIPNSSPFVSMVIPATLTGIMSYAILLHSCFL